MATEIKFDTTALTFINNEEYYILVDDDFMHTEDDPSANYVGVSSSTDIFANWAFTSGKPLTLDSVSPVTGSTLVPGDEITFTFSDNINKGTGNIYVHLTSDDSLVETIDVTDASVSVSGSSISFTPHVSDILTAHYILFDRGIVSSTAEQAINRPLTDKTYMDFDEALGFEVTIGHQSVTTGEYLELNARLGNGATLESRSLIMDIGDSVWVPCHGLEIEVTASTDVTVRNGPGFDVKGWYNTAASVDATIDAVTFTTMTSITDMSNMFVFNAVGFTFSASGSSNVTTIEGLFDGMTNLSSFDIDFSAVTNMDRAFRATQLTSYVLGANSLMETMVDAFNGCTAATAITFLSTGSLTDVTRAFKGCTNITTVPNTTHNFQYVTSFNEAWSGCSSLTSMTDLDSAAGTDFDNMFNGCSSLVCLTGIDTTASGATKVGMFTGTSALTAPTAGEVTDITDANGANYSNASACP